MTEGHRTPPDQHILKADPERLSREELIDLVRALQSSLAGGASAAVSAATLPRATTRRRAPAANGDAGADYTLIFDGGSLGNPGLGYGSYEITGPAGAIAGRKLEFGDDMTNNQAEFHALIAGLERLLDLVGSNAASTSIAVRGDSQLVIRGLTGEWKVKHPGLQPLYRQAAELLRRFRAADVAWHPRRESVRAFGH